MSAGTSFWSRTERSVEENEKILVFIMDISNSILRVSEYYSRHGFVATIRRAGLGVKRALFASRMVVFYCDLPSQPTRSVNIPSPIRIDRLMSEKELSQQDLQEITSFWNPKQARRNIKERFAKGASLWLIRSEDKVAGYGWTLQGCTIEPYYFPLAPGDLHLFNFHVFPQYRGQGMNPLLVSHILRNLATNCRGRAFIEAAEWNEAQLNSLQKTPFRRLGLVRSATIFSRTFVSWVEKAAPER
jgi:ribosomal protein S18 acetylase RimI-like enzyme